MPIYIKTVSFQSWGCFNSKKDDEKVNAALDALRRQEAKIFAVMVSVGGSFWTGVVATYLITYEAARPIRESK